MIVVFLGLWQLTGTHADCAHYSHRWFHSCIELAVGIFSVPGFNTYVFLWVVFTFLSDIADYGGLVSLETSEWREYPSNSRGHQLSPRSITPYCKQSAPGDFSGSLNPCRGRGFYNDPVSISSWAIHILAALHRLTPYMTTFIIIAGFGRL